MDAGYGRNIDRDGAPSLFVWATMVSPRPRTAPPSTRLEGACLRLGAAARLRRARRHLRARLRRARKARHLGRQIGDKIRLVPGHCDATVNLYDGYVGIRGNPVEELWPITARGAVY